MVVELSTWLVKQKEEELWVESNSRQQEMQTRKPVETETTDEKGAVEQEEEFPATGLSKESDGKKSDGKKM